MEADVKTFVGFVAPLAIVYMTWSSITTEIATSRGPDLKSVNIGQLAGAPKLPSAELELRDPFTPEGAVSAALVSATAGGKKGAPDKDLPLHLDGTVLAGKLRFAIINGTRVIEGDYIRGLKLVKVETSRVVLNGGREDTVLPLEIAKSDSIQPVAIPVSGASAEERQPTAAAAPSGGMGNVASRETVKPSPTKKPSAGGMAAKTGPKPGGMGH